MNPKIRRGRATKQRNKMIRIDGQGLDSDCQLKDGIDGLRQRFLNGEIVEPVVPVLIVGTTCAWICFVNLSEKARKLQTGNMEAVKNSLELTRQVESHGEKPNEADAYRLRLFGSSATRLTPFMATCDFNYCIDISHALPINQLREGLDDIDVGFTLDGKEQEMKAERIVLESESA
ncbi:MAG: hypothetical protein M5U26_22485 [Planctomycetota bacterium]|nr:hypothetical protein [Planctomycetota bacterium]